MRKLKLYILGVIGLFALSLGLELNTQHEKSMYGGKNIIMYAEHGRTVL
jgi:hypothetical protein